MDIIGELDCIRFEIGDEFVDSLLPVDIWYGTVHLTPYDNLVYLPQFIASLKFGLRELMEKRVNPDGFFLNLGPTTDDCSGQIYLNGDLAEITIGIEEKFFEVEIPIVKLTTLYSNVIDRLLRKNA